MTRSPDRRTLIAVRAMVGDLSQTARGFGPEQRGQRRMASRVIASINEWLDAADSESADDIDEGLKA